MLFASLLLQAQRWRFLGRALPLCLSVITAGCSGHAPLTRATEATAAAAPGDIAGIVQIQRSPQFTGAEREYNAHRYARAARLVSAMEAQPDLTTDQRAYLERQRTICLQAAGVLPAAAHASAHPARPRSAASADCGPRALALVCAELGKPVPVARLRLLAGTTRLGTSMAGLQKAARTSGLKADGVQMTREGLARLNTPAVAWVNEHHYIAVLAAHRAGAGTVAVRDPNDHVVQTIPMEELLRLSGGYLLLVRR